MKMIKIGSRESKLAQVQTNLLIDYINQSSQDIHAEILTMKTLGDRVLNKPLGEIGGKGVFVKELDTALANHTTDLSVHSLKDMPMEVPESLPIIGYSRREDPRDALILPEGCSQIDFTKPIGCSSQRRIIQFQKLYPQCKIKGIRGNILTRLAKLDQGEYGAIILAAAGLRRLNLEHRIFHFFSVEEMIPAAGQGILCIQGQQKRDYSFLNGFLDAKAEYCATCERAFVRYLEGGCNSPVAAYASIADDRLTLHGLYYKETDGTYITGTKSDSFDHAEQLGIALAHQLRGMHNEK